MMNYVLDCLYFRKNSQSVRSIFKSDNIIKIKYLNNTKADNNNKYDYDQTLGEKHME